MNMQSTTPASGGLEAVESRFALRVAARLNEQTRELPHSTSERLRVAREQALERARLARKAVAATGAQLSGSGAAGVLSVGGPGGSSGWWLKFLSLLPLLALVGGLILIQHTHLKSRIAAAADLDAALLADDLPPAAYSDPGFVEFLKAPRD